MKLVLSPKDRARFLRKVGITDECWYWKGAPGPGGKGQFKVQGLVLRPSRVSYILHKGDIPVGLLILHSCDNPLCVNPAHLRTGTHQDNMNDMTLRGRQAKGDRHGTRIRPETVARGNKHGTRLHPETVRRGTKNGNAKLNEEEVRTMRRLYKEYKTSTYILAKQFGVSQRQAYCVVKYLSYKEVADS